MSGSITSKLVATTLAMIVMLSAVGEASARTARGYQHQGRGRGTHRRHYGQRSYGNAAVGAAVAGTALGIIGLAAGAAAADRYDGDYGYAPRYFGGYAPDGYDYAPY